MYREKSKKQAQTQHLYDTLKKRVMTSQVQTAASDSVAQAINSMSGVPRAQTFGNPSFPQPQPPGYRANDQRASDQYQQGGHGRSPSRSSRNAHVENEASAMPPPQGPLAGHHMRTYYASNVQSPPRPETDHPRWLRLKHTPAPNPSTRQYPHRSYTISNPSEHQSSRHSPAAAPGEHYQQSEQSIRVWRLWNHSRNENWEAAAIEFEQRRARLE